MTFTSDPNMWVIAGLFFLLGLLIGMFLTAGGRRKWKGRYRSEVDRRESLERDLGEQEQRWADQEREWRERDSLRGAAAKDADRDDRVP
jgi:hypothetical protein